MKKNSLLFIISLLLITNINAQINIGIKTDFGVNNFFIVQKNDYSSSQTYFTRKQKEEIFLPYISKFTYSFGINSSLNFYKKFSIGIDLLLTKKGSGIDYFDDGDGFIIKNYKEEFLLFEIPIYLRYNINKFFNIDIGIVNNIYLKDFSSKNIILLTEKKKYNYGIYSAININIFKKLMFSIIYQSDLSDFGSNQIANLYFYNHSLRFGLSYTIL